MRKSMLIAALAATTALSSPVLAQTQSANPNLPLPAAENPNMRTVDYNPRARVQMIGNIGRATIVTFAKDEEVIRVLFGDGGSDRQTWEGPSPDEVKESPLENIVYLYPRNPGFTSISIITKGPKGQRAYQFAALARAIPSCAHPGAGCDDPDATYGLTFAYPEDEAAVRAEAARQAAEARRAQREAEAPLREARANMIRNASMRSRLETDPFAGGACRNWRYEAQANAAGRERIVPDVVTDNGQETVFVFRGNREVPAFYSLAADGVTETPVFPTLRGPDTLALPIVAKEIRLRLGQAVVHVFNRNILPAECVSKTGTTSPDVARVLRQASAVAPVRLGGR